jgi:hypothetical protein
MSDLRIRLVVLRILAPRFCWIKVFLAREQPIYGLAKLLGNSKKESCSMGYDQDYYAIDPKLNYGVANTDLGERPGFFAVLCKLRR